MLPGTRNLLIRSNPCLVAYRLEADTVRVLPGQARGATLARGILVMAIPVGRRRTAAASNG
jgi:hypothetical protein